MSNSTNHKAAIPNPKLSDLKSLVGNWITKGTHPMVPGTTFHGRTTFEWIEGGAFLLMRSEINEKEIPHGLAIFGSDDEAGKYYMLYFDERKVSRKYDVSVEYNLIKWWRNEPGFSQKNTLKVSMDGNTMIGTGEMRKDDKSWEGDLSLNYTRE